METSKPPLLLEYATAETSGEPLWLRLLVVFGIILSSAILLSAITWHFVGDRLRW